MAPPLLIPPGYRPKSWFRTSSIANSLLAEREGTPGLWEVQLRHGWSDPSWFEDGARAEPEAACAG